MPRGGSGSRSRWPHSVDAHTGLTFVSDTSVSVEASPGDLRGDGKERRDPTRKSPRSSPKTRLRRDERGSTRRRGVSGGLRPRRGGDPPPGRRNRRDGGQGCTRTVRPRPTPSSPVTVASSGNRPEWRSSSARFRWVSHHRSSVTPVSCSASTSSAMDSATVRTSACSVSASRIRVVMGSPSPSSARRVHSVCAIMLGTSNGRVNETALGSQRCRRHSSHCRREISSSLARHPSGPGTGSSGSPKTSSAICVTSSSLFATCRYSDIGPTPSSAASRRMDTASSPSASAIAMAVRRTCFRFSACLGAPARRGLGGVVRPTGCFWPVRVLTTVPAPTFVSTSPSSRRAAITLVAVATATPHRWAICRMDGIRSPGRRSPVRIRARISATIRR